MSIAIRLAETKDAAALSRVGRKVFSLSWGHLYAPENLQLFFDTLYTEEKQREEIADPANRVWLVERGEELLGFLWAGPCSLPVPDPGRLDGEIKRLYLLPELHGQGIGSQLLALALAWLKAEGYSPLYIGVWEENYGAQRLYKRHGFQHVGGYLYPVGTQKDPELILRRDA